MVQMIFPLSLSFTVPFFLPQPDHPEPNPGGPDSNPPPPPPPSGSGGLLRRRTPPPPGAKPFNPFALAASTAQLRRRTRRLRSTAVSSATTAVSRPGGNRVQAAMDEWIRQAELWVRHAETWIRQQPPEQIYVAAAVVAFTILVLIAASCLKSSKSNTVVLSGLTGSGKTTLFYQLRDGSSHQGTVTSMEENNDTFVLHSEQERKGKVKPVHIVDVPGHARLKPKLDEVLPKAAGVVFVVDAQDFLSSMQAAAEYLYDILTKATVVKKKIPVLIFCNKTDKVTAHSKEFIKKQLEKEINKLRESRNAISSADISDEVQLGVPGEAFNFSQCQNKVTVAEGAGLTGTVSAVEQFIREYVKA